MQVWNKYGVSESDLSVWIEKLRKVSVLLIVIETIIAKRVK